MNVRKRLSALLVCLLLWASAAEAAMVNEPFPVDFAFVRHFAPNAEAWLYQPGTAINHPVVLSGDETFYLKNRYDRFRSASGAIYILRDGYEGYDAPVITLRGKNNTDDTMFGSLSLYQQPEYYAAHPSLYLISPEGSWQLDIFAGMRLRHIDKDVWVVTAENRPEQLAWALKNSFLAPDPALLPSEEDSWAVLTTESADDKGSRFVLYARRRPLAAEDVPAIYVNHYAPEEFTTVSGWVEYENAGRWLVYGQNDPLWRRMVFEAPGSGKNRPFGDGGCGPTSIAIAIANLVPKQDLPKLDFFALPEENGYGFCTCCINDRRCDFEHTPYRLTTPDDYLRYLPLAVADFSMGNNIFGVSGRLPSGYGTNMNYLEAICSVYGITVTRAESREQAVEALRRPNVMAVTCASGHYTPFTRNSHFLTLAAADDEYVYVLDPILRDTYADLDTYGIVDFISPGLVRVKIADLDVCHFTPVYLLTYEP